MKLEKGSVVTLDWRKHPGFCSLPVRCHYLPVQEYTVFDTLPAHIKPTEEHLWFYQQRASRYRNIAVAIDRVFLVPVKGTSAHAIVLSLYENNRRIITAVKTA